MKLIVITTENIFAGEAEIINRLFEEGLEVLHLRKPHASENEIQDLLMEISKDYHSRIVIHDHFNLCGTFHLRGIHLNRRNPQPPDLQNISVSASCHSLEEVQMMKDKNYVFLSPVFDSVSKTGYKQAFTQEQLLKAKSDGIINPKVMALGGIIPYNIPLAATYGFGGVVVLGWLWENYRDTKNEAGLLKRFNQLKTITGTL